MKKSYLCLPFLFLFIMLACSKDEAVEDIQEVEETEEVEESEGSGEGEGNGDEQEPVAENMSRVGFEIKGEYSAQKRPLKAAETENQDLFAMQFFEHKSRKPYAFVIGDDVSQVTVDFVKDRSYVMKMTLVKNGKNTIYKSESGWSSPFDITHDGSSPLNEAFYSSDIEAETISAPFVHTLGEGPGYYAEVDRYHGMIEEFSLTEENEELAIDLNRIVFGITLNITFEEGEEHPENLYFSINPEKWLQQEYVFPVTNGQARLEIPYITLGFPEADPNVQFLTDLDLGSMGDYQEELYISIGTPEHNILYFDDPITVSRNKMTTIDLAPSGEEDTSNGGMELNFEEGMLEKYIEL